MKNQITLFTLTITILLLFSCKTKQSISAIALSPTQNIVFLDSLQATTAITQDDIENFFGDVGILDMSIQMKKDYGKDANRETVLSDYKQFLKEDVLSFTEGERAFVEKIFKRVLANSNKVSTKIFGNEIRLVKTHAKHYGESVYYTRENIIVIPKHVLVEKNESAFYGTMLHELFHIYSRYHSKERAALYELIGFKDIGPVSNLQIDPALKHRILLNPDGVDFSYAIKMDIGEDKPILAIPIILANTTAFKKGQNEFFSYLDFGLFKISPPYSRLIKVHSNTDGSTMLRPDQLGDFYRQIKDNTNYIIHPDEVMADNFMYLIQAQEDPEALKRFSEQGQKLLADIEEILKAQ
ncbi:MAG: hypothetical protein ACI9VN_000106 [Patescibacteria group bacterium]|jgi:hypothetical protein